MRTWRQLAFGLAVLAALPAVARTGGGERAELGFVYVEANVGGASGGHFALRLGDRVYDYQASPAGLLVLDRQVWERFRFRYGSLENRPIHVAYADASPGGFRRVRDGFAAEYLAQRRQLAALTAARENVELLEALLGERPGVSVRGAGLLDPRTRETPTGVVLRSRVEAEQGAGFLTAEIARVEGELRARMRALRTGADAALTPYREGLAERAALLALREAQGLDPAAIVVPEGAPLSPRERATLGRFRERLAASVVELLSSSRPDRGRALFVAAARHAAVHRSLDESRLVLLDPLNEEKPGFDARAVAAQRDELAAVTRHADALYHAERARALSGRLLDARGYQRLEELGARHVEYRAALAQSRAVRDAVERRPPERSRVLAPPAARVAREPLRSALGAARARSSRMQAMLQSASGYRLLTRNCATEIVATLNRSLGGPVSAREELGAALEPGAGLSFVPFALFAEVRRRLPLARVERLSSYRERRLEALSGTGPLRYLREATTLTSTIYQARHADTSFLLFTDDVFWVRPLYGVINLGYGLLSAVAGAATAPVDRGRRLERGARGLLFSLPELALGNVRKGSFDAARLEQSSLRTLASGPRSDP